ncbi:MAG: hypothetical protein JZU53_15790 [Paludibacter sp.]|nr:hypothetical protein [Paludibacter sp.]
MHTPQQYTASIVSFLSIPHAPFMQSVTAQALFQRISNGMFLFLRRTPEGRAKRNYTLSVRCKATPTRK